MGEFLFVDATGSALGRSLGVLLTTIDGAGALGGGFAALDWLVVAAVLVLVTWLGHRWTGKQSSVRDFYLGGRKLPWYAVSASIIATEISAVTFFAVPSLAYRGGGSLEYLKIGLFSALIARLVVAFVLTPAYFKREIYSPYDYMGDQLGAGVRRMTTGLFMVGGILGQAARVYVTAVVIQVLAAEQLEAIRDLTGIAPLVTAVGGITIIAVIWTLMGGVATVIWTDALLFLLFLGGIGALLATLHTGIPGGLGEAVADAEASGRLRLWPKGDDGAHWTSFLTSPYGWASVLIGAGWGLIGPYGTDQLIAQRMLTCKSKGDAQLAVLGSYLSVVIVGLSLLVGIGLVAYFEEHTMSAAAQALVAEKPERILPIFVREELPVGLRGLILAAAFAAAISSLDSILAALGQTTQSLQRGWAGLRRDDSQGSKEQLDGQSALRRGRWTVLFWGAILATVSVQMVHVEGNYKDLLQFALGMSGIIGGPILAAFALSWQSGLGKTDGPGGDADVENRGRGAAGYVWAAPLGTFTVIFAAYSGKTTYLYSWYAISALFLAWLLVGLPRRRRPYGAVQTLLLGFVLFLLTRVAEVGQFDNGRHLAWPWYVPVGSLVTFVFSHLLDKHGGKRS